MLGYASDGGLYVPESLPSLATSAEELERRWSRMDYPELVRAVCGIFVSKEEADEEDVDRIVGQVGGGLGATQPMSLA